MEQQDANKLPASTMDVFLVALGGNTLAPCSQLAHALRKQGAKVAIDYSSRSLKAQLKQASRVKARYSLIVGEDEWSRGEGILRNMKTQEQQPFALTGSSDEQGLRLIEAVNIPIQ
jgi:histidyl-tRNA synthetase